MAYPIFFLDSPRRGDPETYKVEAEQPSGCRDMSYPAGDEDRPVAGQKDPVRGQKG
jgi:hypothetical protein